MATGLSNRFKYHLPSQPRSVRPISLRGSHPVLSSFQHPERSGARLSQSYRCAIRPLVLLPQNGKSLAVGCLLSEGVLHALEHSLQFGMYSEPATISALSLNRLKTGAGFILTQSRRSPRNKVSASPDAQCPEASSSLFMLLHLLLYN